MKFMKTLDYLKLAGSFAKQDPKNFQYRTKVNLITNFTDDTLQKFLLGICLTEGIYPQIFAVPYKQYPFFLKDKQSELYANDADISFVFFEVNPYVASAFSEDPMHLESMLNELYEYCLSKKSPVIVNTFAVPYQTTYGNLLEKDPFYQMIETGNRHLRDLARELSNLYLVETENILNYLGVKHARDFRSLYAFDLPFTSEFLLSLAETWVAYLNALLGRSKKCIVVDLDNTLWGGIVGETGALSIELGPETFHGRVFQSFQKTLLEFHKRGIILAINSHNNPADVEEAFAQNPNMILRLEHFAAIKANWNNKVQNFLEIAEELNIGLNSMVFLDDDPLNREVVAAKLPEVLVPPWPDDPEQYVPALLGLKVFTQLQLTDEDLNKGKMYAEERQRKEIQKGAGNIEDFIRELGIKVAVEENADMLIPRIAQLTQKTNQFNLTTKRYTEKDVENFIQAGSQIFTGTVSDKFGDYGTTILAIIHPETAASAKLDSFLMSCRVMGRGVEEAFLGHILSLLAERGVKKLVANYIPTAKNIPAKEFLPAFGFTAAAEPNGNSISYVLEINRDTKPPAAKSSSITVHHKKKGAK